MLFFKAYIYLFYFDSCVRRGDFRRLYRRVRERGLSPQAGAEGLERVCSALERACVWYWKELLCLERSAALACLLKDYGLNAELVIGAQPLPFKAHAWVEVHGRVVNDKPYMREVYAVLDRC